jgi:hypothetical protein
MWACGPLTRHRERNNVEVQAEASSSASPGSVMFEELTSFLMVPAILAMLDYPGICDSTFS